MKCNFTDLAKRSAAAAAICIGLSASTPVFAHHSFAAEYDANKPIKLEGTVTKMDWVNPHSWLYIDVAGPDGKVENWACETAPPNGLYRRGWRKDTLKPGDKVIVDGYRAKDGTNTINARSVSLPDGRKVFAGTSGDGGPESTAQPNK